VLASGWVERSRARTDLELLGLALRDLHRAGQGQAGQAQGGEDAWHVHVCGFQGTRHFRLMS